MARGKNRNRVDGWLLVDKPAGITSSAVVNKARWAFHAQKAGHAGTLDPEATGLLAIAFGEATKTIPYITDDLKAYEFVVRLGQATNTDDAEGEVIMTSDNRPSIEDIQKALKTFTGSIEQIPPQFSAVKIDGVRAYKMAREGEEMTLTPRPLYVERLQLIEQIDADHIKLKMVCGKGGYVRSIARDLGQVLGCYGHVLWLRRLWSGPFDIADAISLDLLDTHAKDPILLDYLLPSAHGLQSLPEVTCDADAAQIIRNGNAGPTDTNDLQDGDLAWVSCDGDPVAIGVYQSGTLHPKRVLAAP